MPAVDKAQLMLAALRARERAVAPYSKFQVGAALLTTEGKVFCGANVESASYGLTCCAERVALFHALTSGEKDFVAIAITAADADITPCGACRQLLFEYAKTAKIFLCDSRKPKKIWQTTVTKLLPGGFEFKSSI